MEPVLAVLLPVLVVASPGVKSAAAQTDVPAESPGQGAPPRPSPRSSAPTPTSAPAEQQKAAGAAARPATLGPVHSAPKWGAACGTGTKTIFFDLSNGAFRNPETTGRGASSRERRATGTPSTASQVTGCVTPDGSFQEEAIRAGESVRLVLLNADPGWTYSLLYSGGQLGTAQSPTSTGLGTAGPICGADPADCDADANELDALMSEMQRAAKDAIAAATDGAGAAAAQTQGGKLLGCASSGGVAAACMNMDAAAVPTPPTWWPRFNDAQARALGTYKRFSSRKTELCSKWKLRLDAFHALYSTDPRVEPILKGVHRWAAEITNGLAGRYTDIRQIVATIQAEPALGDFLVSSPAVKAATREAPAEDLQAAWDEMMSSRYYRSNLARFDCPGPNASPADLDRKISDALVRYREARRLLDHAASTVVFAIGSAPANTEVKVALYAAPSGLPVPAQSQGSAAASVAPAYSFSYVVEGTNALSFALGTAVAFHRSDGEIVSPQSRALLFLDWHVCRAVWCDTWGLQAGMSLTQVGDLVGGKNTPFDLYVGAAWWPIREVVLSLGVVDATNRDDFTQLGVYLGVSADVPALVRAWQGVRSVIAPAELSTGKQ